MTPPLNCPSRSIQLPREFVLVDVVGKQLRNVGHYQLPLSPYDPGRVSDELVAVRFNPENLWRRKYRK
jgi:hypothetical protein